MEGSAAELRGQFDEFDSNGDGHLDEQEFGELVVSLGVAPNPELVLVVFAAIDLNGDGHIDFSEFSGWWESQGEDLD